MRFKGQLLVPSESGPGLRVDLEVAGHHLAVESESGDLGAWPLETVRVRRLQGDTFEMTVAGEDLHFIADDAIGFAYSGMPAIEEISGFSRSRGRLRGLLSRFGPESPPVPRVQAEPPPDPDDQQPPPAPASPADEPVSHEVIPVAAEIAALESDEDDTDDEDIIDIWALPTDPDPETVSDPLRTTQPQERFEARPMADTSRTEISETAEGEGSPSCPGVTSEGLPCRSPILGSSGYCYNHDPDREVEDGYRKALEARERMKRKSTAQLTKVYSRLEKAMREVERGELEPDIAVAMAQIARTMCAILDLDTDEPDDEGGSDLTLTF